MGILTGCGLQKISMVSTLIGYYLLSLPIGSILAFRKDLGVFGMCNHIACITTMMILYFIITGLWIGIVIGLFTQVKCRRL